MSHLGPLNYANTLVWLLYLVLGVLAVIFVATRYVERGDAPAVVRRVLHPAIAGVATGMAVVTGIALASGAPFAGAAVALLVPAAVVVGYTLIGSHSGRPPLARAVLGCTAVGTGVVVLVASVVVGTLLVRVLDPAFGAIVVGLGGVAGLLAPLVVLAVVHGDDPATVHVREVAGVALVVAVVAAPMAGMLFPAVPLGTTDPALPDQPATLTNESVTGYVERYESTLQHRRGVESLGCEAAVVNRSVLRSVLEGEDAVTLRYPGREGLPPRGDGYYVAARCGGVNYLRGKLLPGRMGHGDLRYGVVYFVNDSATIRLGTAPTSLVCTASTACEDDRQ